MKKHPYEYKVLLEYINPEERGQVAHFSHAENQQSLAQMIEKVFAHLPESIPEGWEVNSHNIAISRDTLILTILLRRPVSA